MPVSRRARAKRRQVHAELRRTNLQNVQHLEDRKSLGVRRHFVNVIAVVVGAERRFPSPPRVRQIVQGHGSPEGVRLGHDRLCDFALVEGVPALPLQNSKCAGEARIAEQGVGWRRLPIQQVSIHRFGIIGQDRRAVDPIIMDAFGDAESLLGKSRGRLQRFLECHGTGSL